LFKLLVSFHFIGGVLVPFFLNWGQISFTQIMLLQSFFVFSTFALEIPTGAVADYLSRKLSIILGALTLVFGAILYGLYPNIYLFLLAEFLWALGAALLSGADEALVYDTLKKIKSTKQSKKVLGRYHSFELAGFMIAAPIGSLIAAGLGLQYTMILMSIPFFLAMVVALTIKEPKTKIKKESKRYLDTLFEGVKYFKKKKQLKWLSFNTISVGALIFFIIWTYQPLLQQLDLPIVWFGFVHAIALAGIQIPVLNNFERLEKIFKSKERYLLLSAVIAGIAFILLGINPYLIITLILLTIISAFGLTRYVLVKNYMHKFIPSDKRATVMSTVSMFDKLVRALLYPLVGLVVDFSLNLTLIVVGILIIFFAYISRIKEKDLKD